MFQVVSPFSRLLGRILGNVVVSLSEREERAAHRAQIDPASRNVVVTLEGLARILTHHPIKGYHVLSGVVDWFHDYYQAQFAAGNWQRYLVYTELDRPIPFLPEEDIVYTYMIAQIALVIHELSGTVSEKRLRQVTDVFKSANDSAVETFLEVPTVMPRFTDHHRISLRVIQSLDRPLNCCPSLHIAYSLLLDNVACMEIAPYPDKKDVMDSIRYATLRMFNSVLYTKQHSLLDVAGGMCLARKVFEDHFAREFGDLSECFGEMAERNPKIDYEAIRRIYAEMRKRLRQVGRLPQAIGGYLEDHGYARVRPDADLGDCYFDTRKKKIRLGSTAGPGIAHVRKRR